MRTPLHDVHEYVHAQVLPGDKSHWKRGMPLVDHQRRLELGRASVAHWKRAHVFRTQHPPPSHISNLIMTVSAVQVPAGLARHVSKAHRKDVHCYKFNFAALCNKKVE